MESFNIGEVFSKSAAVFMKNFMSIALLTIGVFAVPMILLQAFGVGPAILEATRGGNLRSIAVYGAIAFAVGLIIQLLVLSSVCFCTVQSLAGRSVSLGEMVSKGIAAIPATIGITLIFILVAVPSALLLYIPFIIMLCIWWVAVPVAIAERPGVLAALKRSGVLTKGSRWKIFGLMIIYLLVSMLFTGLVMSLLVAGSAFSPVGMMQASQTLSQGGLSFPLILSQIVSSLLFAFVAVVVAVCYVELRRIKDGTGIAEVAQIFS